MRRAVLAGIVVVSGGLLAVGTTRVKEWTVMTDELLYTKLARHIADTGSPLPVLHGGHVGFLGVVYSILLAPFYGWLDPVSAYDAAHIVNPLLFASVAVPTYLLGRRVVPSHVALVVAALSIGIPWAVNTATAMSESAAYPVFVWAVLACHTALTQPSPRSDATAIGGLALAFFTRPQFLVLAAILLLAVLLLEGPRAALGRHRLLAGACVLAILVVVPLAALGETHRLLGDYGVTATQGSVLPPGIWKSAAIHIDLLALGLGVLPFLLGVGWTYSNFRGGAGAKRAFAVFTGLALPLLALETASYDVRFGGVDVFRTRYLFYLTPLLLLASAAALVGRLPVWGIVGATVFFSATIAFAGLPRVAGILLDSGESVLNGVIRDLSPGLPAGVFIALCGLALGGICLAFQWLPRPLVLVGASVLTFAFCASTTGYAFERLLSGNTAAGFPVTGQDRVRDWVDRAAEGRSVAVLAYPVSRDWGYSAIAWWDAEFWNNTIRRAFIGQNGRWTYTPFAATTARFDPATGEAPDTDKAPKLVLVAPSDSRFGLVGKQVVANAGLALMKVKRPWRAAWTSTGLYPDGWIHPNHPARVRIYSGRNAPTQIFKVAVILDSPPEATHDVSYRVGTATGTLAPTIRAEPQTRVCVPAGGHADITLQSQRAATIGSPPIAPVPGPTRNVGLIVSGVQLSPTGNPCSPG